MSRKYILDEAGNPVLEPDLVKWGQWFEHNKERTRVNRTVISEDPEIFVSTVFLALDHSYSLHPSIPPVLWETMVFGGDRDQEQHRYTSREDAEAGHERICCELLT